MEKAKIIAIVGPTASGKTALSLRLASDFGGEIISCDSMQIYRGMDIGTAKPTDEERKLIPHHLIDIVEPSENFSCADYKKCAEKAIEDIRSRGKLPIFCGGTGLYLDSVLSVDSFSPDISPSVREGLEKLTSEQLWEELISVDPRSAALTHINNRKRVIRYLEIYRGTGKTKTEWDSLSHSGESKYDPLIIGLDFSDRAKLYERIDRRVDMMLAQGLADEVGKLALDPSFTSSQAIGYKELLLWQNGSLTYGESVELLKKNTRNYAKRQLTWFRRNKNTNWFFPDTDDENEIYKKIVNIVEKHLS